MIPAVKQKAFTSTDEGRGETYLQNLPKYIFVKKIPNLTRYIFVKPVENTFRDARRDGNMISAVGF